MKAKSLLNQFNTLVYPVSRKAQDVTQAELQREETPKKAMRQKLARILREAATDEETANLTLAALAQQYTIKKYTLKANQDITFGNNTYTADALFAEFPEVNSTTPSTSKLGIIRQHSFAQRIATASTALDSIDQLTVRQKAKRPNPSISPRKQLMTIQADLGDHLSLLQVRTRTDKTDDARQATARTEPAALDISPQTHQAIEKLIADLQTAKSSAEAINNAIESFISSNKDSLYFHNINGDFFHY